MIGAAMVSTVNHGGKPAPAHPAHQTGKPSPWEKAGYTKHEA